MRKIGIPVAMVVASLGVAGIAQAVDVNQGLVVKTTGKKGTKAKPSGIQLSVTTTTSGKDPKLDGSYATKSAVIHFDKHLKFYSKSFKTCDFTTVSTDAASCPKGSKVGKGSANATVGPPQAKVTPSIEAYNAAGGKLNLKLIKVPGQLDSSGVLTGTLKPDTGKYGSKLVVPIPAKLQNQLGLFITLTKFATVISKQKAKGHYYVESSGCTGGKYSFGGDFVFSDNTTAKVVTTAKC